jgi:hypothetical protein
MNNDHNDEVRKNDKDKEKELVITPGGPRARHLVHQVNPDEMITHDAQGNPYVVPRKDEHSKT